MKNIILIVDDNKSQRKELYNIISKEYFVIEASSVEVGLEILKYNYNCIVATFVNLYNSDNIRFLQKFFSEDYSITIPIIATIPTDKSDTAEAFNYGISDFITLPYIDKVVIFRLKNVIARREIAEFNEIKYKYDFDVLTGIYNKDKFFENTKNMLQNYNTEEFSFFRFDVNRFHLINQYFGKERGNEFLKYIAEKLVESCNMFFDKVTYGRIEADIFGFCIPTQDTKRYKQIVDYINKQINDYDNTFDSSTTIGIVKIENNFAPIDELYDKANLAAKSCKGSYSINYSVYKPIMGKKVEIEQTIINEMGSALAENQFEVWYQVKQDIKINSPAGAEALVRWNHPKKGIIPPNDFIPIFEHNGLITKLDYYVWEKICQDISEWIKTGEKVFPISANVSRVDLADVSIVENITELVDKYKIPHNLFNLEITESAYTDNPKRMISIMKRFKENGFTIMMDDFGNGYSSLSILKDIDIDVLKIDTRFFDTCEIEGRGRSIIASVIRMAKWLHIPVVAEGIEEKEQVDFLRGLGCEYVQGYYFSKPLPKAEFEKYISSFDSISTLNYGKKENSEMEKLWNSNSVISDIVQPAAIFEFCDGSLETIHLNNSFYDTFGFYENTNAFQNPLEYIEDDYREDFIKVITKAVEEKGSETFDYKRKQTSENDNMWVHMKVKYISEYDGKCILYAVFMDITSIISVDQKLNNIRNNIDIKTISTNRMLIVDDDELSRKILDIAFNKEYHTVEAASGVEALKQLELYNGKFDVILLDLIMPEMDGIDFLKKKNKLYPDIPVIVITTDDSKDKQIEAIKIGASDYIIKPFVREVTVKRVNNVLKSKK